jgi:hypothetical protein
MNVEFGRYALVQSAQKCEKLLMSVTRLAFGKNRAGCDVQGGK